MGIRVGKARFIKPWKITQAGASSPARQARAPQVTNAPRGAQLGVADVYANLLMTTLAVVVVSLPPGKPYSESAPQAKYQGSCEQRTPLIPDQIRLPPRAAQWSESAPQPKYQVQCEQKIPLVPSSIQNPPRAQQWSESAPQLRQIGSDRYVNLSLTTLAQVATAPFKPVDYSTYQAKAQVESDQYQNYLTVGLRPPPRAAQWSESAPYPKYQVQCEQAANQIPSTIQNPPRAAQWSDSAPAWQRVGSDSYTNLLTTTLAVQVVSLPPGKPYSESAPVYRYVCCEQQIPLVPTQIRLAPRAQQWSDSAPQSQRIGLDTYPNLLVTTLAPTGQAPFKPVDYSAYQSKFQVQVDAYPNLLLNTLAPPQQPPPPGSSLDYSQLQPPVAVIADQYQNLLVLGYPPPVIIPVVPDLSGAGGGGGGYRWHNRPKWSKKGAHRDLTELLDKVSIEVIYSKLVESPKAVKAAKVVRPETTSKALIPPPESINWQAIENDVKRVARLIQLWRQYEIEQDDEEWMFLS